MWDGVLWKSVAFNVGSNNLNTEILGVGLV